MKCECNPTCTTEIDGRLSPIGESALESAKQRQSGLVVKRIKFSHIPKVEGKIVNSFYSTKSPLQFRYEAVVLVRS